LIRCNCFSLNVTLSFRRVTKSLARYGVTESLAYITTIK